MGKKLDRMEPGTKARVRTDPGYLQNLPINERSERQSFVVRVAPEMLAAFDECAERRGMSRNAAIEKLMRRQIEIDVPQVDLDDSQPVKRPNPTRVFDEREIHKAKAPCRHPVNMRIGDACGACLAKVGK